MSEGRPEDSRQDRTWGKMYDLMINRYHRAFEDSPNRAEAARERARQTADLLLEELAKIGASADAVATGFDRGDFERIISWMAFDYSVETPNGIDMVEAHLLAMPAFIRLTGNDLFFPDMNAHMEDSVISMRLYRHHEGLKVRAGGTNMAFVNDFEVISGASLSPPEGQEPGFSGFSSL